MLPRVDWYSLSFRRGTILFVAFGPLLVTPVRQQSEGVCIWKSRLCSSLGYLQGATPYMTFDKEDKSMDPAQMVIPVLSIAAAAAFTFYAVSFNEIREKSLEKSLEDLENSDTKKPRLKSSYSAKEWRAMKKATKERKKTKGDF
uniref:Uncharacterized protein n=1 Tax=Picea sitchensis TaxID=3332 RepID=A9NNG3_PICSI|nr:unknown [Picea sitchensis]